VDVSCAALPEHLVESELFGREKGAYSSAESAKPGLFELADRGTLFLDEVGELEPRMQVKLLRVLDGVPYYRLGGTRKISVDVRVVTATNRDLASLVSEGRFRSDLYHRLTQLRIDVPPLRERPTDILPLARYFLAQGRPDCEIANDARRALEAHHWPGNVRELRNVILRGGVMTRGSALHAADLPDLMASDHQVADGRNTGKNGNGATRQEDLTLEGMERRMIFEVLERTGGHQQRAAELLGISRRTLNRKLKAYAVRAVARDAPAEVRP
jgi:transcriptional regulator with PAS, ATPase and Fis domain